MAKLKMADRKALPTKDFALPGKGKGAEGKGSGSYPIPDESHARNALARSSGKPVEAEVRSKVAAKFPAIGQMKKKDADGDYDGDKNMDALERAKKKG